MEALVFNNRGSTPQPEIIALESLRIDRPRRQVMVCDQPITMRTKEFQLLTTLAENFEVVLSREQLLEMVWGYNFYGETRTIDVHVQHVRRKIDGSGLEIKTIRGVGYMLAAQSLSQRSA